MKFSRAAIISLGMLSGSVVEGFAGVGNGSTLQHHSSSSSNLKMVAQDIASSAGPRKKTKQVSGY